MQPKIWENCQKCKVNCCKQTISCNLFLTKKEKEKFADINNSFPCKFLNNKGLCKIHNQRPIDCRLFPFDIIKENNKFFWAYYQTNCPIIQKGTRKDLELCLKGIEKKIIPDFKEYIEAYSQFRLTEFISNFGQYKILRKVIL